jgi:hypothetical protein
VKRLFWALVGIGLGAVVGIQVVRWAERTKKKYSPPNLAREGARSVRSFGERLRDAIDAGVEEMTAREAEIREELGLPVQFSRD